MKYNAAAFDILVEQDEGILEAEEIELPASD